MENTEPGIICRLCLGNVEIELEESLYEGTIHMLELCLPEMDLTMCDDCALCVNCYHCLRSIYKFKMKCLQTEEKLRLYLENCDPQNINLKHIAECVSNCQDENAGICRSCLNLADDFISVQVDNSNCDQILKNMFMTCIPEVDLNLSNGPIICATCIDCLKKFYSFKSKCLQTEEEIFTYKEDTNTKLVNLAGIVNRHVYKEINFQKRTSDCKVKIEPEFISVGKIEESCPSFKKEMKTEIPYDTESKTKDKDEGPINIENFKPEIKLSEGEHFHFVNCGWLEKKEEPFEHLLNNADDPNLPTRLQALSENATKPLAESPTWYTCETCSYQSKWRHHLERHKQVHEAQLNHHRSFKCFKCGFVTKYKHALLRHSTLEHGDWFKCVECEYQTKWKRCYNQHLLNHRGGQIWHHCELCSYKTKWKYHLKRHMVTHQ